MTAAHSLSLSLCDLCLCRSLRPSDLNFSERSADTPEVVCATLVHSNKIVLVQEENKLNLKHLQPMLDLCIEGNSKIFQILKQEVRALLQQQCAADARGCLCILVHPSRCAGACVLKSMCAVSVCVLVDFLQTKSYSEAILRSRGLLNA